MQVYFIAVQSASAAPLKKLTSAVSRRTLRTKPHCSEGSERCTSAIQGPVYGLSSVAAHLGCRDSGFRVWGLMLTGAGVLGFSYELQGLGF